MDFTPSSYQMLAQILKKLTEMLDKSNNLWALAQAMYKGHANRKIQYVTVFNEGDKVV